MKMKLRNLVELLIINNMTTFLSIVLFAYGTFIIISGVFPQDLETIKILNKLLPHSILLISHTIVNIVGISFLVISYGIYQRVNSAYYITMISLVLGIIGFMFKGFMLKNIFLLSLILLLLYLARDEFYRQSDVFYRKTSKIWILSIVSVIIFSIFLGLYIYKDIKYSHDLWWQFSFYNNASFFLRKSLLSLLLIILLIIFLLFKPALIMVEDKQENVREKVLSIIDSSNKTKSSLALLDDKKFFFNKEEDTFIMYGVTKSNLISMGDPIGLEKSFKDIVNIFYEKGLKSGRNIVFYEVDKDCLHNYLDIGLKVVKIGEEAIVNLKNFSLEGAENKKLRYVHSKLSKLGLRMEVSNDYMAHKDILKEISDEWLTLKSTSEKSFSLGSFSDEYLKNFRVALLYHNDRIVAFANITETRSKEEVGIDLMRYSKEAPSNSMEYLFIKIILWAQEEGYQNFTLGMVPLSGVNGGKVSAKWNKYAEFIFNNGNSFYNFEGLKRFKEKFFPEWRPVYIAYSGNFNLLILLKDVSTLISKKFLNNFK